MESFTDDNIQAKYREELATALENRFNATVSFIMTLDILGVPESTLSRLNSMYQPNLSGLSIEDEQWMINQSLVDGVFNQELFDHKFPTGTIVEIDPGDYQFKPTYGYILTHPLENK